MDDTMIGEDFEALGHDTALDGTRFNLSFIITYQFCLLAVVALLTARHWAHLAQRGKRIHEAQPVVVDNHYSEHGHTPQDGEHFKITAAGPYEITPLLSQSHRKLSTARLIARRYRSLFMVHPTRLIDLPGNDTTISIVLLLALNIFYAFYGAHLSRPAIFVLADRVGLLFVANLPWLYLLGAKNQPFRLLTGSSYESLNVMHRGLGRWLAVLAAVHAIGMVIAWYDFLLPRGLGLWWYLTRQVIWLGIASLFCYQILNLTSLATFRQWWYEMFLACHIVLQAGGLIFLYFHYSRTRPYVLISLVIFLMDRLWYRLTLKTRTFTADLSVMEDGQTVMVSASWPLKPCSTPLSWLLPHDMNHGWDAADHVFLTVPALARKHKIQAHPFTIASAAPDPEHTHAWLALIIRAHDGFTKDLLQHAKSNATATIRLDGPYGSSHATEMLLDSDQAVIVAGGSGIAVAFPLIWKLLHNKQARRRPRVCLIWIVNDARHISWIGHERLDELREIGLKVLIPPPTAKAGRPDVHLLLKDNLHDLTKGDLDCKTALVVSGPDAMNRAVRNTCARLAWDGMNVNVAVEVFGW